jgi:hypothetical protein
LIAAVFRKICEKQGFLKVFGASELLERVSELLERVSELLERVSELLERVFGRFRRAFAKLGQKSGKLRRVSEPPGREFEEPVRAAEEPGVATERFRRATTGSRFTAKEFPAAWRGCTVAKNLSKILMGIPARVEFKEGAKSSGYYRPAENLFASINTATFPAMIFSQRAISSLRKFK